MVDNHYKALATHVDALQTQVDTQLEIILRLEAKLMELESSHASLRHRVKYDYDGRQG
jgi:hypothetical protein